MVTFCWIYHGNKTPSIFGYGWPTTNSHEVAKGNIIWHIHVQAASTGLFFPSSTLSAAQDKQILKEIIVVDDGSRPPLRKIMSEQLLSGGPGVPKMKIVRHEHTLGLISAKKSGDVFFCWWFGMLFVWVILFCDIMISILICIYIYTVHNIDIYIYILLHTYYVFITGTFNVTLVSGNSLRMPGKRMHRMHSFKWRGRSHV